MFPDFTRINEALDNLADFQVELRESMDRIATAVERLVEIEEANQPLYKKWTGEYPV